jgi:hypothetical protein
LVRGVVHFASTAAVEAAATSGAIEGAALCMATK